MADSANDYVEEVERVSRLLVEFDGNSRHSTVSAHLADILHELGLFRESRDVLQFRADELTALREKAPAIADDLARAASAIRGVAAIPPVPEGIET